MPRRKQAKVKEPEFAMNWQRKFRAADRMCPFNFSEASISEDMMRITLADDVIESNEHYYVVSTAGEPFAIGRIVEFVKSSEEGDFERQYSARLNWLYRPASIHKRSQNTRELLLTMHSDIVPLESLRSKVTVCNKMEIPDLEKYIEKPNYFWFDRYWDRYISRFYDVLPSSQVTNVPPDLGPILRDRLKYLLLEPQRTKLLTETPQFCVICDMWCSDDDSVRCCNCDESYHRGCTNPPIEHPLKGYSWSCGPCSAARERKIEEMRGPDLTMRRRRSPLTAERQKEKDEKEAERLAQEEQLGKELEIKYSNIREALIPKYKEIEAAMAEYNHELTPAQLRSIKLWPFRYLGINASIKDIFDLDDRIYPRAISRVGNKHQAFVSNWPGRPVVYYRKIMLDRRKRGPKSRKSSKDQVRYEPDDLDHSLPWVQEAPSGYTERGTDLTSTLTWSPNWDGSERAGSFLEKTKGYANTIGVHYSCPNFIDACLLEFMNAKNEATALEQIGKLSKKKLKEPDFSDREVELFEKGVGKYGNSLHEVYKYVRTQSAADIVRFYYLWKKSEGGHRIWDDCQARPSRQKVPRLDKEFTESIADKNDPTLNYSIDEIKRQEKSVYCKFCATTTSREWRKAPHVVIAPEDKTIEALCARCSRLWYRYAVEWENPEIVMELSQLKPGSRARPEPELIEDAIAIFTEKEKFNEKRLQNSSERTPHSKKRTGNNTIANSPVKRRRTRQAKEEEAYEDELPAADNNLEEEGDKGDEDEVKMGDHVKVKDEEQGEELEDEEAVEDDEEEDEEEEDEERDEQKGIEDEKEGVEANGEPEETGLEITDEDEQVDSVKGTSQDLLESENELDDSAEETSRASRIRYHDEEEYEDGVSPRSGSFVEKRVAEQPNYCMVCCQYDPSFTQLTCQVCNLSVHAKCYGFVDTVSPDTPWHCDCCLNDKDHQADHIYQCDLCPVKQVNYVAWLAGERTGVPDALKRTWDGKWSHVRCAVWAPPVLFESSKCLQQVEIYPFSADECVSCWSKGACIACHLCGTKFHPGCAGAHGFTMGFLFAPDEQGPVSWDGRKGGLKPIIICGAHSDAEALPEVIPMSEMNETAQETAMQLYAQHYKQAGMPDVKGSLRRSLIHATASTEAVLVIPLSFMEGHQEGHQDGELLKFLNSDNNLCSHCKTVVSPYWIRYPDGCVKCCTCYWTLKDENPHTDLNKIIEKIGNVFDAAVVLPRSESQHSMRIQDILS